MLKVHFEPKRTGIVTSRPGKSPPYGQHAKWYHVEVRNRGATAATECEGYLVRIDEWEDGDWSQRPDFDTALPLQWANTRGARTIPTIEPRSGEQPDPKLDVLYTMEGYNEFNLASRQVADTGLQISWPPGRYRLFVQVRSQSQRAESATCALQVEFDGSWDAVAVRQVPVQAR